MGAPIWLNECLVFTRKQAVFDFLEDVNGFILEIIQKIDVIHIFKKYLLNKYLMLFNRQI